MIATAKFWGLPLWLCCGVCVAMAITWWRVWPRDRVEQHAGFRFVVLRTAHALTWALLALAALVAMLTETKTASVAARLLSFGALASYVAFLITTAASPVKRR